MATAKNKPTDQRCIKVLKFLEAYEKQENLWNPAVESYKNKVARDESYMCIIRELNVPNLTINDIKLKVKSIRTTYSKELRLLIKHKAQGKSYIPKLFWFNRANSFLKKVSLSRGKRLKFAHYLISPTAETEYKTSVMDYMTEDAVDELTPADQDQSNSGSYEYKSLPVSNIENHMQSELHINDVQHTVVENEMITNTNHSVMQEQQPEYSTMATSNVKISPAEQRFSGATYVMSNSNKESRNPTPTNCNQRYAKEKGTSAVVDEIETFCRSVAAQLRSITDTYSRSVAKLKIQQILFEAETGHYCNSPCVSIPTAVDSQHLNNI